LDGITIILQVMTIDYSIVSTNENPTYKDFWEVVKPVWIHHVKINPILVNIGDSDDIIDHGDYVIFNIKKIDGVDTGFQSQISRLWVTKFFQDAVCLTSDIDMLPMSEKYFKDSVRNFNDDTLVIYSSDAYNSVKNRYPMCYNTAKGKTFTEVLELDKFKNFKDFCETLLNRKQGWDTDELFLGESINKFHDQSKIIKLNRGWSSGQADKRIDRISWKFDKEKIHEYIDSHLLRPYSSKKSEIDQLILLLTQK